MRSKNRLKAIFVSLYATAAALLSALSAWQLVQYQDMGELHLGWLGAGFANVPMALTFAWLLGLRREARTSAGLPIIRVLASVGIALTLVSVMQEQVGARDSLIVAIAGLVGFLIYIKWYSVFENRQSEALEVGGPLPDFSLEDAAGVTVSSKDFAGKPALFMFYRGNWCPLCMAQIKEIAARYREMAERGVEIVLISPQPHGHTASLAKKFDVPFRFMVDPGNKVAEALGIAAPGGLPLGMEVFGYEQDTVMPTVVITDSDGVILFADQTDNYRIRPEPDTFLKVLDDQALKA